MLPTAFFSRNTVARVQPFHTRSRAPFHSVQLLPCVSPKTVARGASTHSIGWCIVDKPASSACQRLSLFSAGTASRAPYCAAAALHCAVAFIELRPASVVSAGSEEENQCLHSAFASATFAGRALHSTHLC